MKTLRKLDLDEMARTMSVISELGLSSIVGAYDPRDCVWHCLAYAYSNGANYNDEAAYSMAQSYHSFNGTTFNSSNYTFNGTGNQLRDFVRNGMSSASGTSTKIAVFNPSQISGWSGTSGVMHAIIMTGTSGNNITYFDPSHGDGVSGEINATELNNACLFTVTYN